MMKFLICIRMNLFTIAKYDRHIVLLIAWKRHHKTTWRFKKHLFFIYAIKTGIILFFFFSIHNRKYLDYIVKVRFTIPRCSEP